MTMFRLLALTIVGVAVLACAPDPSATRTTSGAVVGAAPATQESLGIWLDERREVR
jgi:hypothetical protein